MTLLSEFILERLQTLGIQQKALGYAWFEAVGALSGETYVTRISDLVRDEDRGHEWFNGPEGPARLEGLAKALQCEPSKLAELLEAARSCVYLVIDPELPSGQRAFLREAEASGDRRFQLVELSPVEGGREALRDRAKQRRNSVVVLANHLLFDFLAGAGVQTDQLARAPHRFKLVKHPDLIPETPLHRHDVDGTPLFSSKEHEDRAREVVTRSRSSSWGRSGSLEGDDKYLAECFIRAEERGEPVLFRFDYLSRGWGVWSPTAEMLAAAAIAGATGNNHRLQEHPFVWVRDGKLLGVYPPHHERVRVIADQHPVAEVASYRRLVTALARLKQDMNPSVEGGEVDLSSLLADVEVETGFALPIDAARLRKDFFQQGPTKLETGVPMRRDRAADARFIALIDELLERQIIAAASKGCHLHFLLEAVRSASLVHQATSENCYNVVANVGAGRLIHLDVRLYPAEKRRDHVRLVDDRNHLGTLDVGDLVISMRCTLNEALEGTVGQRRREEERRARDD